MQVETPAFMRRCGLQGETGNANCEGKKLSPAYQTAQRGSGSHAQLARIQSAAPGGGENALLVQPIP